MFNVFLYRNSNNSDAMMGLHPSGNYPPTITPSGIIFETNFANDGAYAQTQAPHGDWVDVQDNPPEGFAGVVTDVNGRVYGVPGSGVDGSVAMKIEYGDQKSDPENMLYLHLTGDRNTGYPELYIRYNVRFPEGYTIGNPSADDIPFWKWLRLWQNTGPTEPGGDWSENRADSGYVVNNWSGEATYGYRTKHTFSAAVGSNLAAGSNGGERYSSDWYNGIPADFTQAPGYFNAMGGGDWDFNPTTRQFVNSPQTWHTIEWRFKLASSPTANDGVFQIWYDGVEQTPLQSISPGGGAPVLGDLAVNGIPTPPIAPSNGWNMLTVFDNMSGNVHSEWDAPHIGAGETRNPEDIKNGIFLNDLVVSTDRIGHDYQAGSVS